jgi:two-component system sensor histidine kinase VanS
MDQRAWVGESRAARNAGIQTTTNLVHNAIVHNLADHGNVWVTTSANRGTAVLTVESTGEQLTPQLVSTLAEPFQRGTQRIRADHAGVGLGLAIVNSITQAHEGILTLTPRTTGGLCVTVRIPARTDRLPTPTSTPQSRSR